MAVVLSPAEPQERQQRVAAPVGAPPAYAAAPTALPTPARRGVPLQEAAADAAAWVTEYVRDRDSAAPHLVDLKARIAHYHAPLVESIARRYLNSGEPFEDLVQEGYLGLLSALDHYDPERGAARATGGREVKFSTYATHFVAGSIRHFLRDRGKIIKEPAWLHEVSGKVSRAADRLSATLGRAPDAAEIGRELNLTEEAVEEILRTRQTFQVAALGSSGDDDASGLAVGLVDPEKIRSDRHETLRLPIEDRIVLEAAVEKLKALEQKVLFEFFYQDLSQTEIARKMDISCNYVSHILKNSTQKLRRVLGEADVHERRRAGTRGPAAPQSVVHPASGLFAPAHLRARIDEELGRAARAGQPAALLLVRVCGLPAGGPGGLSPRREEAWRLVGAAVHKTLRRIDIAGHASEAAASPTDELLLLLPSTGPEQARAVAQRLGDVLLAAGAAAGERLVVSVGAAQYPAEGRSLRDLLPAACAAADSTGRSATTAAPPSGPGLSDTAPSALPAAPTLTLAPAA